MSTRLRPRVHFTAAHGWVNDPHGLVHVDGTYHLFFQHVPEGTLWQPSIHWGHATSSDLYSWQEQPVALRPLESEKGCWTGCVVLAPERPVLLYTSVLGEAEHEWQLGRVAVAHGSPSLEEWERATDYVVVPGPPPDVEVLAFRDPFVWRHDDGWTMLMGARLERSGGAVLQYRSPDLLHWTYDGVIVESPPGGAGDIPLGTMWECPQLVQIDGHWVLITSIWDDNVLLNVVYAIGEYDGRRFAPRTWGLLSHGRVMYATSAFLDADDRRCIISWIREDPALAALATPDVERAGALSIPFVLACDGERLTAQVHPGIAAVARPLTADPASITADPASIPADPASIPAVTLPSAHARIQAEWSGGPDAVLHLVLRADAVDVMVLRIDGAAVTAHTGAGHALLRAPVHDSTDDSTDDSSQAGARRHLDLVLDADILEMVVDGVEGVIATRLPLPGDGPLTVSLQAQGAHARVARIDAAELHA